MDEIDGERIPDEEITAAVAVGASVIEHWSTVFGIAMLCYAMPWSDLI